jgi:hypothetical protein
MAYAGLGAKRGKSKIDRGKGFCYLLMAKGILGWGSGFRKLQQIFKHLYGQVIPHINDHKSL